jgi:hypothetical protein
LDFGYISKKRRTPFYWVSKLRRAIRKWLQPLDFGYISIKKNTIFVYRRKRNFETILPSFLGTSTKNEEPLFLGNRTQKNGKILEKWKSFG